MSSLKLPLSQAERTPRRCDCCTICAKIHATLDDPDLVSRAGRAPVMALPARAGPAVHPAEHVQISPAVRGRCPSQGAGDRVQPDRPELDRRAAHDRLALAGLARLAPLLPGRQRWRSSTPSRNGSMAALPVGPLRRRACWSAGRALAATISTPLGAPAIPRWQRPGRRCPGRAWSTPSGLHPHVRFTKDGGGRSSSQHPPLFPRAQRGAAGRLGPMLRAAVASTVTLRRFRS